MDFEERLLKSAKEYFQSKKELTENEVREIFDEHFVVLGVKENATKGTLFYNGKFTIGLPGPDLFEREHTGSSSDYFEYSGTDDVFKNWVMKNKSIWPEGSGRDGLIDLNLMTGNDCGQEGHAYVQIQFNPFMSIPNNKISNSNMSIPSFPEESEGNLTERVYVAINGWPDETVYNVSDHGRIRHILTESYARFKKSDADVDKDDITEMIISIQTYGSQVTNITPRVLLDGENVGLYRGAPLGDGSVTSFFKHMEYDKQLERILK